jgi:PadR family transcriptional regulator PadR
MRGVELKKKIRDELELDIPPSAIYVVLKMLENKGLVVSNWEIDEKGSARKIYRITEEGLDYLNESLGRLKSLKKILEYLHS